MENQELAKNLLELRHQSISSAAKECGLSPSNVAGWLRGRPSTLSRENQNAFLIYLGLSEGGGNLDPGRVHVWDLRRDLMPLSRILSWTNKTPFEMVYLSPSMDRLKNYFKHFSYRAPLLIRSRSSSPVRIVFHFNGPLLLPETKFQKEDFILIQMGLVKWRNIPKKWLYPLISVDTSTYEKFLPGKEPSEQEFEQVWNSVSVEEMNGAISTETGESEETPRRLNSQTNGNIVIVKDKETGLLGAVVLPTEEFCSVVFENGEWVDFVKSELSIAAARLKTTRKMADLVKVGEAGFTVPEKGPNGENLPDIQRKYVEMALGTISSFKTDQIQEKAN